MGLTNSQKSRIIKIAQENNYQGDYESLFEQAMTDGIFDTPPEPDVENKKQDANLEVDNLLVPNHQLQARSPLGKSSLEPAPHTNSSHETVAIKGALNEFINDPMYKPQEAAYGGYKKKKKKYEEGGTETSFVENDTQLDITRPAGDPWEYAKNSDGSILARKRVSEGQDPNPWLKPIQGSEAYSSIKDTVVFNNTPKVNNLSQTDSDEVRTIYKKDPGNFEGRIDVETKNILDSEVNTTASIQDMLVKSGYDIGSTGEKGDGVDGDWGPKTSAAFKEWSQKNLSGLPEYKGQTENICIPGGGCSEVTTNFLMQLFPGVNRDDLGPEDAWYRAKHVVELGGDKIWGVSDKQAKGDWNKLPDLPPVEVWENLQVGDLVHLNRPGDNYKERKSEAGYNLDMNRSTEHVGFIIGKDPNTGLPLIAHGDKNGMFVQPMNEITLGGVLEKQYKVDAITRSTGTKNNKPNLKDHYIFNSDRQDRLTLKDGVEPGFSDSLNPFDKEFFPSNYVNLINMRMDKIAETTGYSRELVAEAAKMGYGIFANETGDWSGILKGKAKEFVKDVFDADLLANLREIPKDIQNYWETGEGIGNFIFPDKGAHVSPDRSEPSRGVSRIKFDMQTHDANDNITTLGKWYKANNITKDDLSWHNPDFVKSMYSGYEAVTLQVLDYIRRAKKHKEYDPKTNTIAGVPLYYAVATMHKSPDLSAKVDENHSVLDYLKKGDRDYSNAVLERMKEIDIKYDTGEGTGEIKKAEEFYKENNPKPNPLEVKTDQNMIQRYLDKITTIEPDNTRITRPIFPKSGI